MAASATKLLPAEALDVRLPHRLGPMNISWPHDQCILCLRVAELTVEHLIPESLGGQLTLNCLCQPCNSRLGYAVEAAARRDPALATAIHDFSLAHPSRAAELVDRTSVIAHGPAGQVPAQWRDGEVRVRPHQRDDASLIQPTPQGRETIRRVLKKQGLDPGPLEAELSRFDAAEEGVEVEFPGLSAVKWPITGLTPDRSGPPLSDLVPVKVAFEFLAGHVGASIYDANPALDAIRTCLTSGHLPTSIRVARLRAERSQHLHGILFEGNLPHAQVQLRLFGRLAYRVHFTELSVSGRRLAYTHLLDSGEEYVTEAVSNVAT